MCDQGAESVTEKRRALVLKAPMRSTEGIVSFAAVIRVVTQRFSPLVGEKRCVTTLITAAEETTEGTASLKI